MEKSFRVKTSPEGHLRNPDKIDPWHHVITTVLETSFTHKLTVRLELVGTMGFPLSLSRPSFKQAVGVVVIKGVGLPDTRNHEAEFPEGAGSRRRKPWPYGARFFFVGFRLPVILSNAAARETDRPSEGAETADGALRRRVDGPVAIRLTKRPPEQRPPRKTENGRRGKAQAAFQCPAFPESWGHIEVASTPGSVIVAGLPVPLPIPRRSGSSTVDQDGGSHPPAAWTRLQASNTWHPVADPSCGPVPTSSSHPVMDSVTVPAPHGASPRRDAQPPSFPWFCEHFVVE
ncbi:hypothetical protein HPB47_007834 [Ixodes persulcatus]|uniref:Uncharacterized protein n=1 Tax=Ixodes persulcatus TaxID=34615 RepID=A0AC60P6I5_IXOPE|nr:hypothetical protein HPB47_007834 [Ixodes persulcatus]